METFFDLAIAFSFPTICSYMVQATEELSAELDPPYSRGLYFLEIRRRFLTFKRSHCIYGDMCESIFTLACRHDFFYCDENFAKFSYRRINENYKTFSENLREKFPGYIMAKSAHIMPSTDITVHLDDLLSLLRSNDLARYEREKSIFFGPTSRYLTGTSSEQMSICYATYPRSGNSLMRKYFENVTGTATGSDMIIKH